MPVVSGVKDLVQRAFKNHRTHILFNEKTGEVVGAFNTEDKLPGDKLVEGAQIINLTKTSGKVMVLSREWVENGGAMQYLGFNFFSFKITDLSTLPPDLAEALSDLLREKKLTLDTSPQE